jgi:thiamine biosynthesis lipoprotein
MTQSFVSTPRFSGRRSFLQLTAVASALALAGGGLPPVLLSPAAVTQRATRLLMGTQVNLTLIAPDVATARQAIATTYAAMERLIAIFDHRQPASALAVLNRTGKLEGAPAELLAMLRSAIAFGDLTDGAFDVTVKPLLDAYHRGAANRADRRALVDYRQIELAGDRVALQIPGAAVTLDGIAKGRVIDGGVAALQQAGFDQIVVEAGGDLRTLGRRPDHTPWRVGVLHPRPASPGELLAVLTVGGEAVATSGDYMNSFTADFRQHHILDPRTGESPDELAAATVLASTALEADALGTALMVLGSAAGLALAERLPGVEALVVTKGLRVLQTGGVVMG